MSAGDPRRMSASMNDRIRAAAGRQSIGEELDADAAVDFDGGARTSQPPAAPTMNEILRAARDGLDVASVRRRPS